MSENYTRHSLALPSISSLVKICAIPTRIKPKKKKLRYEDLWRQKSIISNFKKIDYPQFFAHIISPKEQIQDIPWWLQIGIFKR